MNLPGGMIVPQLYGRMESEYRGENSETRVPDPNFNLKALRSNCSTYSAVSSVLSFPRSPTRSPKLLTLFGQLQLQEQREAIVSSSKRR